MLNQMKGIEVQLEKIQDQTVQKQAGKVIAFAVSQQFHRKLSVQCSRQIKKTIVPNSYDQNHQEKNEGRQVKIQTKGSKQGNTIIVTRRVTYGNQQIDITDKYKFYTKNLLARNAHKSELTEVQKKNLMIIPKQPFFKTAGKRNFKNSVKNLIKGFQLWLKKGLIDTQKQDYQSFYQVSRDRLVALLQPPFNNRLIVKIGRDIQANMLFYRYLDRHGQLYIKSSKINDKQSHLIALEKYKSLMQKMSKQQFNINQLSQSFIHSSKIEQGQ